jgi:glutamate-1-semialdehyde aminotransferase
MILDKNNKYLHSYKQLIPGTKIFNDFDPFEQKVTPFCFKKGKDSFVWDIDNNKYLDFHMSLGSIILGHANKKVNSSALKQLKQGITFSLMHDLEIVVARQLIDMIPSAEMVRFGKNGSDVLAAGVRLARYITKREKVLSCGWHGIHDWSLANTSKHGGIPDKIRKLSLRFEFNNIHNLYKIIKKNKNEVSCIVMDLCARYYPEKGYLQEVKELAKKNKIILIFDEIVTGFRMHPGGAQGFFNIVPDLSCFGKGIANGFPLSALVGKEEYMKKANELFYSLTFAGETVSLAAANTALKEYRFKELSKNLEKKGNYLIGLILKVLKNQNLENFFKIEGMPCRPIISLRNLKFGSRNLNLINLELIKKLAEKNILYNGSVFICKTHTFQDLKYFANSFEGALEDIKNKFKL